MKRLLVAILIFLTSGSVFAESTSHAVKPGVAVTFPVSFWKAQSTPAPSGTPSATPSPGASATPTPSATPSPSPSGTPFSPDQIAGLRLWLKADALGLSNNDPVATWTDSSGTANDATQATSGARPVFKTSIINSLPVVRFDGTDDYMSFATDPSGGPTSTFVVGSLNVAPSSQASYATFIISAVVPSGVAGLRVCGRTTSTNWGTFTSGGNLDSGEDLVSGTFNVLELTANGSTSSIIYRNGTLKASNGAFVYGNGTENWIGGEFGTSRWLNGDIAEIVVYDTVLSAPDRVSVETYLAAKYGL